MSRSCLGRGQARARLPFGASGERKPLTLRDSHLGPLRPRRKLCRSLMQDLGSQSENRPHAKQQKPRLSHCGLISVHGKTLGDHGGHSGL